MPTVETIIIGAGQAGLAMSRCLTDAGRDHLVLDRGAVANRWTTERWDSLRLLTPNWMTRLPGYGYDGPDPDGYLTAAELAVVLEGYARGAPVRAHTTVSSVRPADGGFAVATDTGTWHARSVVLAAGLTRPVIPRLALPDGFVSVAAAGYKNPGQLPGGGVLVVGASSSGVQLAEEIHLSGRPVTLSVGEHVRLPRRYRDRDILWWLDACGILEESTGDIDDLIRARNLPSMQLIGAPRTLDLNALQSLGVRLVGRLGAIRDGIALFSGSLRNVIALADLKLNRLLNTIDEFAGGTGERPGPTAVTAAPLRLDLRSGEIRSVVWATGVMPDFSWLDVPVFDPRGRLRHTDGVVDWPGLYVTGLPVLRRRRSSLIDGAAADTAALAGHLAACLRPVPAGSPT
jgi:putative flavoprotein involved in K+ transport